MSGWQPHFFHSPSLLDEGVVDIRNGELREHQCLRFVSDIIIPQIRQKIKTCIVFQPGLYYVPWP